MPLGEGCADLVVASYSLEECADPEAALREIHRVLRPGGVVRVAYQRWELREPAVESVTLLEGAGGTLLYQYARRTLEPARERRYTLVVPGEGEAAAIHSEAVVAAASGDAVSLEEFDVLSREIGERAAATDGEGMVTAARSGLG